MLGSQYPLLKRLNPPPLVGSPLVDLMLRRLGIVLFLRWKVLPLVLLLLGVLQILSHPLPISSLVSSSRVNVFAASAQAISASSAGVTLGALNAVEWVIWVLLARCLLARLLLQDRELSVLLHWLPTR